MTALTLDIQIFCRLLDPSSIYQEDVLTILMTCGVFDDLNSLTNVQNLQANIVQ